MVIFDTTVLLLLLHEDAKPPIDPETGEPVKHASQRIERLVSVIRENNQKIIIPTPVLCEALVGFGNATQAYMDIFEGKSLFSVLPFDRPAALEAAKLIKKARGSDSLGKYATTHNTTRGKIKFDLQIMAIAKVRKAHTIYSDDSDMHRYAQELGITVSGAADLKLPPEPLELPLVQ